MVVVVVVELLRIKRRRKKEQKGVMDRDLFQLCYYWMHLDCFFQILQEAPFHAEKETSSLKTPKG